MALPRVTRIIRAVGLGPDFSAVPIGIMQQAQARGRRVHAAIEAYVKSGVEPVWTLDGYLVAYRRFQSETGFRPIDVEVELEHPVWRYAGRMDCVGWLNAARVVVDFKTGDSTGVQYQLAGYVEAWNAMHPDARVRTASAVLLRENGTYKMRPVDLVEATPVWYAAVVVYQAMVRNGRKME